MIGFPRRRCVDQMTPAELAITAAKQAVEEAGCDPRLTAAIVLLSEARDAVANFVDGVPPVVLQVITDGLDFGAAVAALKSGQRVARAGWNGKAMWLRLVHADAGLYPDASEQPTYPCRAYLEMKDATDHLAPWLASQTDVLAEDWSIVEGGTP